MYTHSHDIDILIGNVPLGISDLAIDFSNNCLNFSMIDDDNNYTARLIFGINSSSTIQIEIRHNRQHIISNLSLLGIVYETKGRDHNCWKVSIAYEDCETLYHK